MNTRTPRDLWEWLAGLSSDELARMVAERDDQIQTLLPELLEAAKDKDLAVRFASLNDRLGQLSGERVLLIEEQIVRGEARGTARPFRYERKLEK